MRGASRRQGLGVCARGGSDAPSPPPPTRLAPSAHLPATVPAPLWPAPWPPAPAAATRAPAGRPGCTRRSRQCSATAAGCASCRVAPRAWMGACGVLARRVRKGGRASPWRRQQKAAGAAARGGHQRPPPSCHALNQLYTHARARSRSAWKTSSIQRQQRAEGGCESCRARAGTRVQPRTGSSLHRALHVLVLLYLGGLQSGFWMMCVLGVRGGGGA